MDIVRRIFVIAFLFISSGVFTQGEYLEKGINGFGMELRTMLTPQEFKGAGLSTGYSIAGILDIGFNLQYTLGELGGNDSSEISLGFDYNVHVLKQSAKVPMSLQIMGSYSLSDVSSDYLETNNLERKATGYTIGAGLSRKIRFTPFWLLRLNVLVDYENFTYTDTDMSVAPPAVANQDRVDKLSWGGGLGFLFVFPQGQTLAVQTEIRADRYLELEIHPILAMVFPQK